ncbi:MAG: tRNA-dihydrouridine synthase family protein [Eubacteriales bacterium]|nr:tRNA-dihydrouridine synthase family protein [Eubacteriales bacterium]
MKFYFAPMEGLTGYIYRNAHHSLFNHVDKYFAPFIFANQSDRYKNRELKDILPENNGNIVLIPQLLTNNAKDFIHTSKKIKELSYDEINLNLGCPYRTVVSKNRGAGFLAMREELNAFLEEVFEEAVTKISIKTRIGKDEPEEFYELIEIYNKYPMEELIIHPRIQKDFYKNKPNHAMFKEALSLSKNPVCYNGDLFSVKDFERFHGDFPDVDTMMLGRGLLINPGLIGAILGDNKTDKVIVKEFHDKIYADYKKVLSGDTHLLHKMKEVWSYMILLFPDHAKQAKRIKKAERIADYEEVVSTLFREKDISTEIIPKYWF